MNGITVYCQFLWIADTTVVCKTPEIDPSKDRNQTIRVHFDGLTTEISVNYVDECGILLVNSTPFLDKEFSMHINVKENRSYRYCMSKVYIYLCNHH
jgi:hypothetical protein